MRNFGNVLKNAAENVSGAKRQNTRKNADFHFLMVPLNAFPIKNVCLFFTHRISNIFSADKKILVAPYTGIDD